MARARMIWWVLDDGEAWQVGGALCFADMDGSGISRTGAPVLGGHTVGACFLVQENTVVNKKSKAAAVRRRERSG
jgi:hypothetical protein